METVDEKVMSEYEHAVEHLVKASVLLIGNEESSAEGITKALHNTIGKLLTHIRYLKA